MRLAESNGTRYLACRLVGGGRFDSFAETPMAAFLYSDVKRTVKMRRGFGPPTAPGFRVASRCD